MKEMADISFKLEIGLKVKHKGFAKHNNFSRVFCTSKKNLNYLFFVQVYCPQVKMNLRLKMLQKHLVELMDLTQHQLRKL